MLRSALLILTTLAALPAMAQTAVKYEPEKVALPAEYQTKFIRYAMVEKADRKIIRFLYVNPEAFAAAKKGEPMPSGTVIVMEDHAARVGADGGPLLDEQGRFIPQAATTGIFLQEKRTGWGTDYPAEIRNGEWEYARFNPDGTRNPGSVEGCFACHLKVRASQDFTFNFWDYLVARK